LRVGADGARRGGTLGRPAGNGLKAKAFAVIEIRSGCGRGVAEAFAHAAAAAG
jgi:hypothetical protein